MRKRLNGRGFERRIYGLRQATVEPVFGQIKEVRGSAVSDARIGGGRGGVEDGVPDAQFAEAVSAGTGLMADGSGAARGWRRLIRLFAAFPA